MITALAGVLLAAQSLSPEVLKHVAAGSTAQKAGRYDEAIAEFIKVAELAPTLAPAFVNLGNVYMQKGDFPAAILPLRRSLELNPDLIGARQMLGNALLASGYATEALPHLEKTDPAAFAIALYKAGRIVEAVVQLKAALDQHPNDPDLLYYLGRAAASISKESYDGLQAAHPASARTHQLLGELYAVQRKLPEAEKEYREALRIRPNTPEVRLRLAEVYAAAGAWDRAAEELRIEAQARPGDTETAYRLGSALLELGRVSEARTELERGAALDATMPETLYALGKACSLLGDLTAAEKHWRSLLEIEKESALAGQTHFGLAAIYRKRGDAARAAESTREFQRLRKLGAAQ